MPHKRTGIMPSKKNFTSVGGVGARNLAMQNKISRQAPRVATATNVVAAQAPAPEPASTTIPDLFDIVSFSKTFKPNAHAGYPDTKLEDAHINALTRAASRWTNFLSFHPAFLNVIKTGYKLLGINYSYNDGNNIAAAKNVFPYGFLLDISKNILTNGFVVNGTTYTLSDANFEHVLAHELGHALGLCNTITPNYIVVPNHAPNADHDTYYVPFPFPVPYASNYKCIVGGPRISPFEEYGSAPFVETYIANYGLLNSTNPRAVSASPYIILSDGDGKHWKESTVKHQIHAWDARLVPPAYKSVGSYTYENFYNELMVPSFSPVYDNANGYLISSKSLKYLTEIKIGGMKMYLEKNSRASEVSSVTKLLNSNSTPLSKTYTYILKGTAGVVVTEPRSINNIPIITVERADANDAATDAVTDATETETNDHAVYSVIYPEGYTGDCNDDDIMRIVRNHERIVNDPAYMANTIRCCSQEMR